MSVLNNSRIMRSCSYPDVMENQEDNKPPPIRISAQVNSAPQDFVVVKGGHSAGQSVVSAYKVSKSSASQPMLSPRPPTQPTENPLESFDPTRLRAELSLKTKEEVIEEVVEAKRALLRQEVEIKRLKRHLWVAEGAGGGLVASQSATKSSVRHKHPLCRVSPLLGSEVDSPRHANDSPCDNESGFDTLMANSCANIISPKNAEDMPSGEVATIESPCDFMADDCTVTSVHTLGSGADFGAFGRVDPLMQTAPAAPMAPGNDAADSAFVRMSASGPLKGVEVEISSSDGKTDSEASSSGGLAARLSMNAKERRRTRIPVTQRLRNLPKHPPPIQVESPVPQKSSTRFEWTGEPEGLSQHGLLLFMIHDNHMLGATVAAAVLGMEAQGIVTATKPPPLVSVPGSSSTSSGGWTSPGGGSGMTMMLESKDDSGASVFVIGTVLYSGDMSSIQGADASNPRGAQCMVIGGVQAVRAKIKDFPTRLRPGNADIKELDFAGLPEECYANIETSADIRQFLKSCPARVDVILDPSRSEPSWYPYWEGARKMAPQFRSKGIGYIRLGDDMSMNGTAFLSTDAGVTFLDDGLNSVLDSAQSSINPMASPGGVQQFRLRSSSSMDSDCDGKPVARAHTPGSPRRTGSAFGGTATLKNILQSIHNADAPTTTTGSIPVNLTWSQRVDLLKKLQKELRILAGNSSTAYTPRTQDATSVITGEWVAEAFSTIADSLVKQKNPNVLKESLLCVPLFGPWIPSPSSGDLLPSSAPASASSNLLAWRSLLLEVVHCLRHANKNASEYARSVLGDLEKSRAITFLSVARLNPCPFHELLIGPVRGNSSRPAPSSSSSVATAANTARVMTWLSGLVTTTAKESAGAVKIGGWTDDDYYYGTSLFKSLKPLLFHREEATREGAVGLMAVLVAYDVVCAKKPTAPAPKLSESPRSRGPSAKNLLTEAVASSPQLAVLPDATSTATLQVLQEVDIESAKSCARIVKDAVDLISTIRAASAEDLLVSKAVVNVTTPLTSSRRPSRSSLATHSATEHPNVAAAPSTSDGLSVRFDIAAPLDDEWYEARLALKKPPTNETAWRQMKNIIDLSADFFVNIKTEAVKHSVSHGAFIRALLPFNESTSSGDQSNVNSAVESSSCVPVEVVEKYRPYARSLRSLIRVKMADAEDLKQAKDVTLRLKSFCDKAQMIADDKGVTVIDLLRI